MRDGSLLRRVTIPNGHCYRNYSF